MQNILYVDRIEEDFAVCESGSREKTILPLSELPDGLREGDCLRETADGYEIDQSEAAGRKAYNKALFDRLLKRAANKPEDILPE